MLFQPLMFLAKMLLANNSQIGCKRGNIDTVLAPCNPCIYTDEEGKKAARVKMRMI